jgi:hypothetical protein
MKHRTLQKERLTQGKLNPRISPGVELVFVGWLVAVSSSPDALAVLVDLEGVLACN